MQSDRPAATAPEWELICWRLALARDFAVRKVGRLAGRLPGAGRLRRLSRRAALLVWWTLTLQLPRHAAYWLHARRMQRKPAWTLSALITDAVSPTALRLQTSETPDVSVLITSFGKVGTTLRCLASIAAWPPQVPIEIIVIDDASGDPDVTQLELVPGVRLIINPSNLGYLRTCNAAARLARGDCLLFLNNDTQVMQGWLDSMLALLRARPDAGAVGSMLLYPDGRLQEAGGIIWCDGSGWNYGRGDDPEKPDYNYVREVDYCSAASLMVSRAVWNELGGFDEAFVPAYCEDSDLACRLRFRGRKVFYQPRSRVVHFEGTSHGTDTARGIKRHQLLNQRLFARRWAATLADQHFPPGCHVLRARERATRRPVVLVIDHYVPEPDRDAGSCTIVGFIHALLSAGAAVKFWPHNRMYSPGYTEALQDAGVEVFYGGRFDAFEEWIAEYGAELDLVVLSRPEVAQGYLGALKRHSAARLAYYGHDLHSCRLRLQAEISGDVGIGREAERVERLERWIWRSVDTVMYPSEEEAAASTAMEPTASARAVVPFGFTEFGRLRSPPPGRDLLFVGGFAHPPTEHAVLWFAAEVLPLIRQRLPDARLVVVGSKPGRAVRALAGRTISVFADVDTAELAQHYRAARIAVAPVRYGAGVKLKVVEALRHGTPLVTTPVGAQGLPGLEQVAAIAADPAGLANAACALLTDDALWRSRCAAQIAYATKKFSEAAFRASFLQAVGLLEPRLPDEIARAA
jgi:O-antigen biosynthesis protein